MHSIRKFVGRGTLAFSVSALVVLAVAVQTGQAARLGASAPASSTQQVRATTRLHVTLPSTLSAQCTAALSNLQSALSADLNEDVSERSTNPDDTESGADLTEDANEKVALKPLFDAVLAQCGTSFGAHRNPPPPPTAKTPACTAAWNALKAAFAADRTEDQSELSAGTEGTTADRAEDQAEAAHKLALWKNVQSACASGTQTNTFSFDSWRQHH